jgi:hypothetical protein
MSANPVRDDTRDDRHPLAICPMCGNEFQPDGRGRFCKPRCRQQAYRLRHRRLHTPTLTDVTHQLRRDHRLIDQTVYECSSCVRFVSSKSASIGTAKDEEPERRVLLSG